jgi:superfamily II DNA or RNA helicase
VNDDDDPRGLYEALVTEALRKFLEQLNPRFHTDSEQHLAVEAADRIAFHLARHIERAVARIDEKNRVHAGVRLARELLVQIDAHVKDAGASSEAPLEAGTVLRAIVGRQPDGSPERLDPPLTPLLDTTLLTNAPGEPRVGNQLLTEIESADRIDVVMAFIRRSGINPLLAALRTHCGRGRSLRVLTTTYTASTEAAALDALAQMNAEIRVSYDTTSTRLHAKAWLFHRRTGFSTAYIGSSNLTHSAQVSGLEWNVRVSGARNPDVIAKMTAVFDSYWNGVDFVGYDPDEFAAQTRIDRVAGPMIALSPIEVRLEPFQERLLEQIAVSRERGYHRNLLASATGTGKTVMAAVDYARLRKTLPRHRLLFVAHREEILDQSLLTFRHALRDAAFGELWVGGQRPQAFEHVFASIQSLRAAGLRDLAPDHFDVVIVDEFHHAAALSYRELLDHIQPIELLGLTATPERSDQLPVLHWFGDRIAAELRVWDAIDQHRLSPFEYYGIHDGLDLREIPWRRGHGYDTDALSNLLTADDVWARRVVHQLNEHVGEIRMIRALAFCVSVDHARFMARVFSDAGVEARAVWGDSPDEDRSDALKALNDRRINVLFSVDLFNEGIDVPNVDTILFLRPTDSPTLFLQQLGRGLRRSEGKTTCTVLDFVGHHRREFRFDRRFLALLGGTRKQLERHIEHDRVATDIVLRNIRESVSSRWAEKARELREWVRQGARPRLAEFLKHTDLSLDDVYSGDRSWSDLLEAAGVAVLPSGLHETALRRVCGRLLHIDDQERIDAYLNFLSHPMPSSPLALDQRHRRLLRMLVASVANKVVAKNTTLEEGIEIVWSHPQVLEELRELLGVKRDDVDHQQYPLPSHPDVPLRVHARYSRIEILAGFGVGGGARVVPWQTGVYWVERARVDLLAFTLDKTQGRFSPTTRYRDYAISPELIHWESQSTTSEASDTGIRYRTHRSQDSTPMLFARLRRDERAFWFLGPADYVRHESERPMAITWRLHHALPGDLFARFAAAVA